MEEEDGEWIKFRVRVRVRIAGFIFISIRKLLNVWSLQKQILLPYSLRPSYANAKAGRFLSWNLAFKPLA